MRLGTVLGILAALAVAVEARPPKTSHVVHEKRSASPQRWVKVHRVHRRATLPVRIGLAQPNLDRAEEFVNTVAHPESPDYGKHWSPARIAATFAASQESIDGVKQWLRDEGINLGRVKLSPGRNWLEFRATVDEVERLLKTEYHIYRHKGHGRQHVACDSYRIPDHLVKHVDIITPTVHLDQRIGHDRHGSRTSLGRGRTNELRRRSLAKRQNPRSGVQGRSADQFNPKHGATILGAMPSLSKCDQMLTPDCIRALYRIPKGSLANANNPLGIVEYSFQAFLQSDLDLFFGQFEPRLVGKGPAVRLLDNAVVQTQNQSSDFNGESDLDLQIAMGLIFPQNVTLYQIGDTVQGASLGNFLDALDASFCSFQGGDTPGVDAAYPEELRCGSTTPINVISESYGIDEADLSPRYVERQCAEYMKLALQGISMVFSSGDAGVAGMGFACRDPVTGNLTDGAWGAFSPSFPSTCPWVISVGATQILNGSTVLEPESACEETILSGGGFSGLFPVPRYQKAALAGFFTKSAPPFNASQFNNSMRARGIPDVSSNGANIVTAMNGKFTRQFGTSASAPLFASVLNMINEKRLQAGKGPVGFVNPVLYTNPQVMNDITRGSNPGCGADGFTAVQGWDPVTGLGTPNYPAMEKLFLSLP